MTQTRTQSTGHYSPVALEERWGRAIKNIRRNLIMSAQTDEKIFLKRWLYTNNVLTISKRESREGISLNEVSERILGLAI